MSVNAADLAKAVNAAWDASSLDSLFRALWASSADASEFPVLHDQLAGGGQPFPYCVFEQSASSTSDKMSHDATTLQEIRDVPFNFRVHAREIGSDSRSPKEIAAYLAEEVMKVFGAHPTQSPAALTLDHGNFLISIYENDYGLRTGEDNYQWVVSYLFRVDVPVAV